MDGVGIPSLLVQLSVMPWICPSPSVSKRHSLWSL